MPTDENDLRTVYGVLTSDLHDAMWEEAMHRVGSSCFYCRKDLDDVAAVPVFTPAARAFQQWSSATPFSMVLTPSGFAHLACQLAAEQKAPR